MTLLAWVPLAFAQAPAGQLMVSLAEAPSGCVLSVDGEQKGALPMRLQSVTAGSHAFEVKCPDGRTQAWTRSVDTAPQKLAMLELGPLTAPAPPPVVGSEPVPTYVLLARIQGEKVRIDGGQAYALPYRAMLTPGPHEFVVVLPDGTERAKVTRDVVPVDGAALVKLD